MKNTYIITREPEKESDVKGKSLGMSDKLAVFYSPKIGRKRFYRQSMTNPQKGLKLLTYKRRSLAESVCNRTNEISMGKFKVECI